MLVPTVVPLVCVLGATLTASALPHYITACHYLCRAWQAQLELLRPWGAHWQRDAACLEPVVWGVYAESEQGRRAWMGRAGWPPLSRLWLDEPRVRSVTVHIEGKVVPRREFAAAVTTTLEHVLCLWLLSTCISTNFNQHIYNHVFQPLSCKTGNSTKLRYRR